MSEGTWEGELDHEFGAREGFEWAAGKLGGGEEPWAYEIGRGADPRLYPVHYSPCDEGCRHGGPMRARGVTTDDDRSPLQRYGRSPVGGLVGDPVASWRSVDVRTLGRPHDLRPGRLAVLCLRCHAATPGTRL